MKTLKVIAFITIGLAPIFSTLAENSVAVGGKVILTTTKEPIGAFTIKAYPTESASNKGTPDRGVDKPLAQTLTRADGTYSLPIPARLKAVILRFEKLSYFSVPPQQTVQLIAPATIVPDVAAVKYTDAQTVSTRDLLDAFSIRDTSFNAMATNLPPTEREQARKKSVEVDLISLQKSGVDSVTIVELKKKLLVR